MSGILDTNYLDVSIDTTFDQKVASADPAFVQYPAGQWTVSNPHPGFGIDPNILNELGHTKYPMYVGSVIVHNEAEEKALKGEVEEKPKKGSEAEAKPDWK